MTESMTEQQAQHNPASTTTSDAQTGTTSKQEDMFAKARSDLLIAAAVAALVMVGAALFAPSRHLWGVVLGTLLALANLSALARLAAQFLSGEDEGVAMAAGLKTVFKVLALMGVVVAVLLTRPEYALGMSVGLALPAVAGLLLVLRAPEWRSLIGLKKAAKTGPKTRN